VCSARLLSPPLCSYLHTPTPPGRSTVELHDGPPLLSPILLRLGQVNAPASSSVGPVDALYTAALVTPHARPTDALVSPRVICLASALVGTPDPPSCSASEDDGRAQPLRAHPAACEGNALVLLIVLAHLLS
jgi:hypothetical protein